MIDIRASDAGSIGHGVLWTIWKDAPPNTDERIPFLRFLIYELFIRGAINQGEGKALDASIDASVGSRGDTYDSALAETIIGHYKTEVIRSRGPWKNIDAVEFATLEWVDWFNNRRLFEPIGDIPPAEYEMIYWRETGRTDTVGRTELSLH